MLGTRGNIGASYLLTLNFILILALLLALIVIQWRACHVEDEKDLNDKIRFFISPKARRYVRFFLFCLLLCITFI